MEFKVIKTDQPKLENFDFSDIPFGKYTSDYMVVAEYENNQWNNWRIMPYQAFPMLPKCTTIQYAQTIFEGMKATLGKNDTPLLFRPELNIKRFNLSAQRMCMPEVPEAIFLDAIKAIVKLEKDWIPKGKGKSLYVRPTMYATGDSLGVKPSETYRFIIFTMPSDVYYANPVHLVTEQKYIRAVKGGTGEAKTGGNYAASLFPDKLAKQKGFDQILWLEGDAFQKIQEVGTMNLFFVIDGVAITPKLSGAILRGTTRLNTIEILQDKGYQVEERDIFIQDILDAYHANTLQEAFGVGTAAVVTNVATITHGDLKMVLPDVENRPIASLVYDEIEGLRNGDVEDTRGWMIPVE